jgi:hypothetical protein
VARMAQNAFLPVLAAMRISAIWVEHPDADRC